jgi:cytochrome c peroxidase
MHDGSVPDLMAVIRHYETVEAERIPEFKLTEQERDELVAFLETL